jgi:hypothetical protein
MVGMVAAYSGWLQATLHGRQHACRYRTINPSANSLVTTREDPESSRSPSIMMFPAKYLCPSEFICG